jgi:hypothetical protein
MNAETAREERFWRRLVVSGRHAAPCRRSGTRVPGWTSIVGKRLSGISPGHVQRLQIDYDGLTVCFDENDLLTNGYTLQH